MYNKYILFLLILSFTLFLATGCDESNPVDSEEQHFEAIGLFIISSGDTIVKYEGGAVTGEVEVDEGTSTALLSVKFITEDGDVDIPPGDEWSFGWEISDTSLAQLVSHGDELALYKFHIKGKAEGETDIKIIINHNGHKDFESKEIPIHVTHSGAGSYGEPEGLIIIEEASGDTIVTYDDHDGLEAGSNIQVKVGEETGHLSVQFFDHDNNYFTPDEMHYSLQFTMADTQIAEAEQHGGETWEFEVAGLQVGNTTLTIDLMHDSQSDFWVTDIPIEVTN